MYFLDYDHNGSTKNVVYVFDLTAFNFTVSLICTFYRDSIVTVRKLVFSFQKIAL